MTTSRRPKHSWQLWITILGLRLERDDGLTLSWLYRHTVRCPAHRWSQHAGLISKDVLTESEKQHRSWKAFIPTQKSVHQTRQTPATHCPKDSDAFGEDRRAYSSFKQMEMFLPVRTWARARSILLLLQAGASTATARDREPHSLPCFKR